MSEEISSFMESFRSVDTRSSATSSIPSFTSAVSSFIDEDDEHVDPFMLGYRRLGASANGLFDFPFQADTPDAKLAELDDIVEEESTSPYSSPPGHSFLTLDSSSDGMGASDADIDEGSTRRISSASYRARLIEDQTPLSGPSSVGSELDSRFIKPRKCASTLSLRRLPSLRRRSSSSRNTATVGEPFAAGDTAHIKSHRRTSSWSKLLDKLIN
ncbi:MAG: hypothetical protein CYPHOPRED_006052 [Cyphobasidiales sp. Tagirdzhanova-0007]|nr:MAG: hypothetical protein CYPHOPRED_006052 [Cyphobasidiales sp. Tagirdzhanova-0007]